jgi:hypothetical protein
MIVPVADPDRYRKLVADYLGRGYEPYMARSLAFFHSGGRKKN